MAACAGDGETDEDGDGPSSCGGSPLERDDEGDGTIDDGGGTTDDGDEARDEDGVCVALGEGPGEGSDSELGPGLTFEAEDGVEEGNDDDGDDEKDEEEEEEEGEGEGEGEEEDGDGVYGCSPGEGAIVDDGLGDGRSAKMH